MLLSRQIFKKHALRTCSYWAPALWKSGPKFNQNCFLSFPFFCADYDTRSDRPSTSSLSFRLLPVSFLQRRAGGHCPAFSWGKLQTSAAWQDLIPACTCEERPEQDHFLKCFCCVVGLVFIGEPWAFFLFVFLIEGGGGGGGGFRLKPHIEVRIKWMWFPIAIFQSPNFSLREGSKKKFDTASSRGVP